MVESTPIPRIYLDVCCLNRPFDDQRQDRVRLEAEAVLLILGRCEAGAWQWLSSAVVEEEVDNTPSRERRSRVKAMLSGAHSVVTLTAAAVTRAKELQATVDVFLTTDDRVLRIATRHTAQLQVCVANPLAWLLEVLEP